MCDDGAPVFSWHDLPMLPTSRKLRGIKERRQGKNSEAKKKRFKNPNEKNE